MAVSHRLYWKFFAQVRCVLVQGPALQCPAVLYSFPGYHRQLDLSKNMPLFFNYSSPFGDLLVGYLRYTCLFATRFLCGLLTYLFFQVGWGCFTCWLLIQSPFLLSSRGLAEASLLLRIYPIPLLFLSLRVNSFAKRSWDDWKLLCLFFSVTFPLLFRSRLFNSLNVSLLGCF